MVKKRITYNTLVYHNQSQFYKDQKTNDKEKQTHTSFYIESSKNVLSTILPCSHMTYHYITLSLSLIEHGGKIWKQAHGLMPRFLHAGFLLAVDFLFPARKEVD